VKGGEQEKMKDFNVKIKTLRKQKKQTQQQIAGLLGVRRSTYGEYERGKILPPFDKIKILAEHFGVSVNYFVDGNEKETQ
jgi:transcriptional regulator with XRE-family HTH domain